MAVRERSIGVIPLDLPDFPDAPESNPLTRIRFPLGLYAQTLANLGTISDPHTRATVAWDMDTYWRERGSLNSLVTLHGLSKGLRILTPAFPDLATPGEVILGKQQPSLVESSRATLSRLDFLNRYVRELPKDYISVISGGSMSYGRFYNVREGGDPSDLDLMVIYADGIESSLRATDLLPPKFGYSYEDTQYLQERLKYYAELRRDNNADVLSHKTPVPGQGFDMSMHILSAATFEEMMVHGPNADLRSGTRNVERRVNDYKPKPFKHQQVRLHDFHGEPHFYDVNERRLAQGVTDDEVITQTPVHAINDGMFIPGLYHNLVSPRFEMEAFSAREAVAAATLFWTMMRRLEAQYRVEDPNASALKSHIRYELFNPHLIFAHDDRIGRASTQG